MACNTREENARELQHEEEGRTTKEYHVEWHIEVSADSPEEAANLARAIQLAPDNTANHFYVTQEDNGEELEINADI